LANIIHHDVHPQDKIVKIVYHEAILRWVWELLMNILYHTGGLFVNQFKLA
jgi:hypothetical protein